MTLVERPPVDAKWPAPHRWLTEKNSSILGRKIVARALLDVGVQESPPGSNRGASVERWLRAANVPESLIESGKGWWCAAWVGAVWRDCGCLVPRDYASCDAWLPYLTPTGQVGDAILYGLRKGTRVDAHHIGVVARIQPNLVTIEGNRAWAGTSNNGVAVDLDVPARRDILGYVVPALAG